LQTHISMDAKSTIHQFGVSVLNYIIIAKEDVSCF